MFFALARMDLLMRSMTAGLLLLPAFFAYASLTSPDPEGAALAGVGAFVVAIYGSVYFWWRPRGFAVEEGALTLVFPIRSKRIEGVIKAERIDRDELKRRYGWQARVGAGGLWGGFGWLYSSRGWMEFYISRMDGYVLLTRREGLPVLISPERPDALIAAVKPT